jgi:Skp family chaperone for outer membrane proteins
MKKLFFLLLLVAGSISAQAQIIDSLPFFNLDRIMFQLEDQIGTFTGGQLKAMQSSVNPIISRVRGKDLSQQQRVRAHQEVRKAIVAELNPAQLDRLKATRKGNRDALDKVITEKNGARRQRQ